MLCVSQARGTGSRRTRTRLSHSPVRPASARSKPLPPTSRAGRVEDETRGLTSRGFRFSSAVCTPAMLSKMQAEDEERRAVMVTSVAERNDNNAKEANLLSPPSPTFAVIQPSANSRKSLQDGATGPLHRPVSSAAVSRAQRRERELEGEKNQERWKQDLKIPASPIEKD